MPRRQDAPSDRVRPSAYDSLIDAERDAAIQAGRQPTRNDLIRALLDASDLAPRAARRAVDSFIAARGGSIPSNSSLDDTRTGWIDGLLDAERANARRDDRLVTRRTMLRAVRQASPSTSSRDARAAVADYLYRRGGQNPGRGWPRLFVLGTIGLTLGILAAWALWFA